ncbi:MAG TPA: M14 family zinc carboxypeptidase [Saprospiraceae bacterium]|nr:M14 family zinc carboxypeptidase [Saprospiraceae bacterium]
MSKKKLVSLVCFLLVLSSSMAICQSKFYKVYFEPKPEWKDVVLAEMDEESLSTLGNGYVALMLDSHYAQLQNRLAVSVIQDKDAEQTESLRLVEAYRRFQLTKRTNEHSGKTPLSFNYGSMSGYFTLEEVYRELDSMALQYPDLVSQRFEIGKSLEGRSIYAVKISDNVKKDEQEPEVFYNAVTHAREAITVTSLIYFMQYLLENYSNDTTVNCIIDHRELFFVPVINPDGYAYNEVNNPNGGGLWRKNVRKIKDSLIGVDLNRNYSYEWGKDDKGSSPNPISETYRGEAPFSEPETQTIRNFCKSRNFVNSIDYHSYGSLILFPWGFDKTQCEDDDLYFQITSEMSEVNGYNAGQPSFILYSVNGSSIDWMYGEQTEKNKIFGISPEIGSIKNFWPSIGSIIPLCDQVLDMNMKHALNGGARLEIEEPIFSLDTVSDELSLSLACFNRGLSGGLIQVQISNRDQIIDPILQEFQIMPFAQRSIYIKEKINFIKNFKGELCLDITISDDQCISKVYQYCFKVEENINTAQKNYKENDDYQIFDDHIKFNQKWSGLEFCNLTGKMIFRTINSDKIDFKNLNTGFYFARLNEGSQVKSYKIYIP